MSNNTSRIHQQLIQRVNSGEIGSEDAATIFFKGRYFLSDLKKQLITALNKRREFCQRIATQSSNAGNTKEKVSWQKMENQWKKAIENIT